MNTLSMRRWEYPDNFPSSERARKHPNDTGKHEMRWLATPRLANKSFAGQYDWLLVGALRLPPSHPSLNSIPHSPIPHTTKHLRN